VVPVVMPMTSVMAAVAAAPSSVSASPVAAVAMAAVMPAAAVLSVCKAHTTSHYENQNPGNHCLHDHTPLGPDSVVCRPASLEPWLTGFQISLRAYSRYMVLNP
jgi:hypothetical protein